ncbi:MAG: HipA domain-containing protein, partial [Oscillospiraceae bacterium]|nr:HipA domain-containing protein [Oscillospiraceae bacterium]
ISKNGIDRKALNDWWTGRSIPASRDGIKEALEKLCVRNTVLLLDKCCGLSLSDQYWICPKGSDMKWSEINFFDNDFSKDMGEVLFGQDPTDFDRISLMSPDNTSDGWLRKKWIISKGRRVLMKGGSGDYWQEPFNEVIASAVLRRLDIAHVDYTIAFDNNKPYSLCENFVTPETELIPAWRIKEAFKRDHRDSDYAHLIRCCEKLGMSGTEIELALTKILVLDYIISNEDRHYNNFGFVRNAETLEWSGFAPIYDSGTSLWYNTQFVGRERECKPFKKSHSEQIKLVNDLSWYNADALEGIREEILEILPESEAIDDERRNTLAKAVMARKDRLLKK